MSAFEIPTVTAALAADPSQPPGVVAKRLYGSDGLHHHPKQHPFYFKFDANELSAHDLDAAAQSGQFPSRPTDLFLKIWASVLKLLPEDPLINLTSPALMASSGVIPLSIISVIPDIIRHYANVIVKAEHEIILATNYWEASTAAKVVTDAFRQLDRQCQETGRRVVVKMMYDRGNLKQIMEPHQAVPSSVYTGDEIKLPAPEEIPHLDLQVINYHRPALGTFHAKYLIVDRKYVCLNSNNIQDRVNMEMMCQYEGPIVEAFYDMALITWNNQLDPALPLVKQPAPVDSSYAFGDKHIHIRNLHREASKEVAIKALKDQKLPPGRVSNAQTVDPIHAKDAVTAEANQDKKDFGGSNSGKLQSVTKRLNTTLQDTKGTLPDSEKVLDFQPHILHGEHAPLPIALVNRKPRGSTDYKDVNNPQDIAWLAAVHYATESVFIQTPTFTAPPIVEACLAAARRGISVTIYADLGFNDAGEALPKQGGTNERVFKGMFNKLEDQYKQNLRVFWYTGADMSRPINASKSQRNCHVKLMIVDGHIGIQGNGNQDAQSYFHSQEVNAMIDSPQICKEWMDGLGNNQNTALHGGPLASDGVWRDPKDGSGLEDAGNTKGGISQVVKGIKGTIARVQGKGGF